MLTNTGPTDTAEFGEISGGNSEAVDSELLSAAARIAAEAAQGLQTSRGTDDWITLFRALAELTAEHAAAGDPQPRFSLATLREKCGEIDPAQTLYWRSEEDTSRKKFSAAWDKLIKAFPGLEANLRQRAEKQGVAGRVIPDVSFDGQDKRAKLFGFVLLAMEVPESSKLLSSPVTPGQTSSKLTDIEYIEEMEVYPIPGIRRPLRINVQGWRALFLVLPPALIALICIFGLWVVLDVWLSEMPPRQIFRLTVTVLIFGGILSWLVWPLYRFLENGIIEAPAILQLRFLNQHVLLAKKEEQIKVLRMVCFTATCPHCGGLVEIAKGRGPFRGRLIGQCGSNRLEHLFSFDHILRRGRWLRA